MKNSLPLLCSFLLTAWAPIACSAEKPLDPLEIEATLKKSADWHLENPVEWVTLTDWHMAPLYDGLLSLARTTGEAKYLAAVIEHGERTSWSPGNRIYHADDHAVGHAWIDIFAMDPERTDRLDLIKARLDYVLDNPVRKSTPWERSRPHKLHWDWCDALFMAPPTLARLSKVTGDQKYLRFMDLEYRKTVDEIYDEDESLFYRDDRFFDQRTPNGEKVFWSRGNGWVYGGLAVMIDALPDNDMSLPFYKSLFLELTKAIVETQNDEGLWWPSLLDQDHVNSKESSGSAFFVYGLAWGINNGLLDEDTYWPAVVKGWNGLLSCLHPNGMLGYVQPVGASPEDNIRADSTQAYGIGGFLLAGSEILKVLGASSDRPAVDLYKEAQAMYENGTFSRGASAYYVPRRADDVAWENDKVAFRVYGPALKDSAEDSGIDIWQKRVDYPIIPKWYGMEFSGQGSYHKDTGEGYDAYKVGASRGCGGTGLWYQGKLHTANTYTAFQLNDTRPDRAGITLYYLYDIGGERIYERKNILLREGSNICDARSIFFGSEKLLSKVKFAIGLVAQSPEAEVRSEGSTLTMWDNIDNYWVATAVKLSDSPSGVQTQKVVTSPDDTLLLADLDEIGRIFYSFGFTWERHSELSSHKEWRSYVSDHQNTINEVQLNGRSDEEMLRRRSERNRNRNRNRE